MSFASPDRFFNNFTNRKFSSILYDLDNDLIFLGFPNSQVVNVTAHVEKPCPIVPPVFVSYIYGAPLGWNAVVC